MLLGGVDEAGRGSVIGPLVIAGISVDNDAIDYLRSEGVCDSKKLTSRKRELLYPKIISLSKSVYVCRIDPQTIDLYVHQKKLNLLESKFMTIVSDNLKADKIIIDACDVNLERFKHNITENVRNTSAKIYCFHKADTDNVVVSAASIIAKVTRDRQIAIIEKKLNERIGSGYPSDPMTRLFIRNNIKNALIKEYIRFSWYPVKCLLTEITQTKIF
ncbi:MAG TPA: ribonuclease HII [Candidatus Saccharimonadales bacterium]|nr:ribonuclease HII [Candidatus Saccharimonadales bacterium]